ncbi:MAG: CvpA family protein [Bacteroidales bacterium]|jgi:membrane protein required for colicin V production|nr:CvpA family protein [Bacteroidales bacterium]
MTFLDILIAIPLFYFIYRGWKHGIIFEIATLLGILAGIWAAVHLSTWVAERLDLQGEGSILTAFFITFVGAVVLAYFLGKVVEGLFKMVKAEFLNKLLGSVAGMLKCLIVISILLNFILLIDQNRVIITPKLQEESILYKPTYTIGNKLSQTLKTYIIDKRKELAEENKAKQSC